jgi:formate-dependent nitrite reductase membrane component NrfD
VPDANFESYYGRPILKAPTWAALDIAGYLFLGGLAGASSVLAAGAQLTDRPALARSTKVTALLAISGSLVALVHDLGRPARFVNMLRIVKVSSPMSVGSWLLALYGPQAGVAATSSVTGKLPRVGKAATIGAAMFGPAVATYTAALVSDTAVPAWHDPYREMPFLFVGSASAAAGGMAVATVCLDQAAPARRALLIGGATELLVTEMISRRHPLSAEQLQRGVAGRFFGAARVLTALAVVVTGGFARRSRLAAVAGGLAAVAGSVCTRFAVFHAGVQSTRDPKYVVVPQRERLERGAN